MPDLTNHPTYVYTDRLLTEAYVNYIDAIRAGDAIREAEEILNIQGMREQAVFVLGEVAIELDFACLRKALSDALSTD